MIRRTKLLVCIFLPLNIDHYEDVLVLDDLAGLRSCLFHSVHDIPLASMVKDTDGPKLWSDGLRNKYVPEKREMNIVVLYISR